MKSGIPDMPMSPNGAVGVCFVSCVLQPKARWNDGWRMGAASSGSRRSELYGMMTRSWEEEGTLQLVVDI